MLNSFDAVNNRLKSFIPPHVRVKIQNWIVDTLAEASLNEGLRNIIRAYRSDAAFQASLTEALELAVQRFVTDYTDMELVDALTRSTHFWDVPSVQKALKEIMIRPSSYLKLGQTSLKRSFNDVLPTTVELERVEQAVHFFLRCLTEEVVNIPQLAPIYQAQFQLASLNIQIDQYKLIETLVEKVTTHPLLLAPSADQPTGPTLPVVNHNLPPQYGEFLGREKDIARVLEGLGSRWPLISIEGIGGIGKTTLAIEVARYCLSAAQSTLDLPFKHVVWVSAKDVPERAFWMNEVLDVTARVLGYPAITKLLPEEKQIEIDQLLRNHRTLVILDDFHTMKDRDPALLSWIHHIPEPSKVLITSRYRRAPSSWSITLRGLEDPDALELIRNHARRLELQLLNTASDDSLLDLVRITGGNPMAIELALAYVKAGSLSLSQVVEHLYAASMKVDDLLDYLFNQAWEIMKSDARQVLLVVPFFEDFANKEALGVASGLTNFHLDTALEELVELMLLDSNEEWIVPHQHYSVHPLIRAFAKSRLRKAQEFEEQARERWSRYYIDFAANCLVRGNPKERYWNTLVRRSSNMTLIDQEWPNLRKVLTWAEQERYDHVLVELLLVLVHYMDVRLLHPVRLYYARKAVAAVKRLNRKEVEAFLRIDALGWTRIEVGRFKAAKREIMTGLHIAESFSTSGTEVTDLIALGNTFLARVFLELGDLAQASLYMEKAMPLKCTPVIRCRVDMIAGDIAAKKNNHKEALELYKNALRYSLQYRDEKESSEVFYRLGLAYLANNDLPGAQAHFEKVLDAEQDSVPVTVELIHAKYGLARVAKAKDERDKARQLSVEAWTKLSSLVPSHFLLKEIQDFLSSLEVD